MRQLAIYGKGGIGKSMVSSHISFALADMGQQQAQPHATAWQRVVFLGRLDLGMIVVVKVLVPSAD